MLLGMDGQKLRSSQSKRESSESFYTPDEIPYPSWFPPLAESAKKGPTKRGKKSIHIMEEVTAYYNTVKRADDSIGQMLRAFDEYDLSNKTIFVLISDHGAELPEWQNNSLQ